MDRPRGAERLSGVNFFMNAFQKYLTDTSLQTLLGAEEKQRLAVPVWHARVEPLKWHGVIVAREWDEAFTEEEYLLMLSGGTRKRREDAFSSYRSPRELPGWLMWQVQRDLDRHCRNRFDFKNVACNAGRTVVLNLIANQSSAYQGVQVFAVGNSSTIPAATDVQLGNELFRKSISNTAVSGSQLDVSTFFGTTDGNFVYAEAGLFGNGADPTITNDGTLFAHSAYTYTKTSSVTLTNDYFIQLL